MSEKRLNCLLFSENLTRVDKLVVFQILGDADLAHASAHVVELLQQQNSAWNGLVFAPNVACRIDPKSIKVINLKPVSCAVHDVLSNLWLGKVRAGLEKGEGVGREAGERSQKKN